MQQIGSVSVDKNMIYPLFNLICRVMFPLHPYDWRIALGQSTDWIWLVMIWLAVDLQDIAFSKAR